MCRATTKEWGVLKIITLGYHLTEGDYFKEPRSKGSYQTKCPPPRRHIAKWLVKMQNSWWNHDDFMKCLMTKQNLLLASRRENFHFIKIALLLVLKKADKGIMNIKYLSTMLRIFAKCFMKAIDVISNACPGQVGSESEASGVFFWQTLLVFSQKVGEMLEFFAFYCEFD